MIIPTYQRRAVLIRTLQALADQSTSPGSFEVIVADDGSTDGTEDAVLEFARTAPMQVVCTRDRNLGANAARNRAIMLASGRLLVVINDDTVATHTFLERHLDAHRSHPGDEVAILGRMTISPDVPWSLFADLHLDASYRRFEGIRELDWTAFYTCNISVKRAFLLRHGLFDERLRWHEDVELGERLSHHGLRVVYEPSALGLHLHHLSEQDYLGVAEREGIALADWYVRDASRVDRLRRVGLHIDSPLFKRMQYCIADRVFGGRLRAAWISAARGLAVPAPGAARRLYAKVYQASKRRATIRRLRAVGFPFDASKGAGARG